MKKILLFVVALLAMLAGWLIWAHVPKGDVDMIKYRIIFEQKAFVSTTEESLNIIAYQAAEDGIEPWSFLAIYRVTPAGQKLVYRYAPVVPKSAGYPRPLRLESVDLAQEKLKNLMIVTSWGEIGADYWGTHPIVIKYLFGVFRATNLYDGLLSRDPRISPFEWTRPDIEVTNYFDRSERVRTILTQGIRVIRRKDVELKFFGDNKAHAAKHKMETIRIKLFK
ncbi:MAG: hypothetical protein KKC80_07420 [Candidatus Margulisbacteria bacterium]|nr:hypothetical protein [Candidatus Margulisiibacteriota bacterium]MBU1617503.1 hypothetical protein [Candidatus Margulisiibacteriota bacterium]MBU1867250.1 hypothetical protein [Candidatus Margulisiibacteriota bacterium]